MKTLIEHYKFDVAAKTVTFLDFKEVKLENILVINHAKTRTFLYNFADPTLEATVKGNVVTLYTDLTGMTNDDGLLVYYEDTIDKTSLLLTRIAKSLESLSVVDIYQRQRVAVDNVAQVSGSIGLPGYQGNIPGTTPGTQSPYTSYWLPVWPGPIDPRWTNLEQARMAYEIGIRSKLNFY